MFVKNLKRFYNSFHQDIKEKENTYSSFTETFYDAYLSGDNTLYQKNIEEKKHFDDEWIKTMESYFPSIDRIILNPKSGLKYEEEIVNVEKSKKVTSRSIRHLSSHTHFIKEIREDGSVIPSKVLSTYADSEYAIYENRFIMTLITRLHAFVQSRYEVIKNNVESFQKTHLNLDTNFKMDDTDIKLSIDFVATQDLDDEEINKHNLELLARVEKLRNMIVGYYNSPFMKQLEKAKPIVPPIKKTNLILKNADFRSAYTLWMFLDRYNTLAYDVDIAQTNLPLKTTYRRDLNRLVLLIYSTVAVHQKKILDEIDELDTQELTRKSTRILKTHPDDVIERPNAIRIEDNAMNEYYLQQNKKVLETKIKDFLSDGLSEDQSLKKAMQESIQITNALFESFFELDEEEDYFKRLVKDVDYEKELEAVREKVKVARIIRETKAVDFNHAIRLEKRLLKETETLNKKILKEEKTKTRQDVRVLTKEQMDKIALEVKFAKEAQETLGKNLEFVSEKKTEIADLSKKLSEKLRIEKNTLMKKRKDTIQKEKEKLKLKQKLALQKIKEKQEKQQQKLSEKLKLQEEKIKNDYVKKQQELRDSETKLLKKELDTVKNKGFQSSRMKALEDKPKDEIVVNIDKTDVTSSET